MTKRAQRDCATKTKPSLYEEITSHIVADLEAGVFPWARPWDAQGESRIFSLPTNAATGNAYSGINILILWGKSFECGFTSQKWLTFNQASGLGGSVRKGEHGTTVCYADRFVPKRVRDQASASTQGAAEEGEASIPLLRRYTVFNLDQCEHLPDHLNPAPVELPERQIVPQAEALAKATLADIRVGGAEAFYLPLTDTVHIPPQPAFFEQINFYRTLFHELGHWTGHPNRLNRDLTGTFGSKPYANEELVAELTAAFVCAALSIRPTVRHADYLGSWLDVLRDDRSAIFRAASKASKAAGFLLAFGASPDG
ncbi:ArdC family protein [Bradyrhizobium liaoningense]|uniref:ArdC family protein n=1 Tax=Bradyrhizobium liaoningense TaxID=43992 RepID=UPI001BA98FF2|nr:zincin-like metallopeptidase domain-containing protein [Bradyrhizobium liaoningense]MBR0906639.1 DUF1738 domain-containing protein [Bradyrhizobium liaoningense]